MNAPLVRFGNGYAAQDCGNSVSFTLNGEPRPTGLEMAPLVLMLVRELAAVGQAHYSELVEQVAEQAHHIDGLEEYVKKLESRTPRMDALVVRHSEWLAMVRDGLPGDVVDMFDYCLQGQCVPLPTQRIEAARYTLQAEGERAKAQTDATNLGMGFIVHGVHVSPDNVTVLGGVDIVEQLREAKRQAQVTLDTLESKKTEHADIGVRLGALCRLVGLTPPSDTPAELHDMAFAILGMVNGKLRRRTQGEITVKVTADMSVVKNMVDMLNIATQALEEIQQLGESRTAIARKAIKRIQEMIRGEAEAVTLEPGEPFVQSDESASYADFDKHMRREIGRAFGMSAADPLMDVNKPITPDAPGITYTCFECGQPVTSGSNFCELHAPKGD